MKINKKYLILLFPIFVSLTIPRQVGILNGNWTLGCYSDLTTGVNDCKQQDEQPMPISLEFSDDGVNGTMKGHTSRNQVCGQYQLLDSNKIKVSEFGGTLAGEMTEWGKKFWKTIRASTSYNLSSSSDTLTILYDNDSKAMVFVKTIDKKSKTN